jgi:SAM-dependent methyltransferase
MAPGWERRRAQLEQALAPVREWLINELAPRPGDTVLELSAGPGDTGFAAAAIVGERGRLISTDFSPDMVEVARRRGAELGLQNVDYRVMDAEHIELDADSTTECCAKADTCSWRTPLRPSPRRAVCWVRPGAWRFRFGAPRSATRGRRSAAVSSSSAATCPRRSPGLRASSAWQVSAGGPRFVRAGARGAQSRTRGGVRALCSRRWLRTPRRRSLRDSRLTRRDAARRPQRTG